MKFKINIAFSVWAMDERGEVGITKVQIIWEQKEIVRWNKEKHFPSIFNSFHVHK